MDIRPVWEERSDLPLAAGRRPRGFLRIIFSGRGARWCLSASGACVLLISLMTGWPAAGLYGSQPPPPIVHHKHVVVEVSLRPIVKTVTVVQRLLPITVETAENAPIYVSVAAPHTQAHVRRAMPSPPLASKLKTRVKSRMVAAAHTTDALVPARVRKPAHAKASQRPGVAPATKSVTVVSHRPPTTGIAAPTAVPRHLANHGTVLAHHGNPVNAPAKLAAVSAPRPAPSVVVHTTLMPPPGAAPTRLQGAPSVYASELKSQFAADASSIGRGAPATPVPPAAASPPRSSDGTVTILGRLSPSTPSSVAGTQVVLYDMTSGQTTQGNLQPDGSFIFARLRPSAMYYLAAWQRVRNMGSVDQRYSWHQIVQSGQAGAFAVDLNRANADTEYTLDVLPMSAIRTPGAGRRAQLTPLNGG